MIIIEDAPNQLPSELEDVEDYIVATYSVTFDDITDIANGYVQNCICGLDMRPANFSCFGEPCEREQGYFTDRNMTLWKSWNGTKVCPDDELDVRCVRENCNYLTTDNGLEYDYSSFGSNVISCATQAEPFFRNPEGYSTQGSTLLAVNGQLEPTLNITSDTWVRLRLGYMATKLILCVVFELGIHPTTEHMCANPRVHRARVPPQYTYHRC